MKNQNAGYIIDSIKLDSLKKDAPKSSDEKKRELKRHKAIALACLVLAFVVFAVSVVIDCAWLKACSEAAMVGGLADWFAVSALFRKPLGWKYHTDIIARNKDKIAQNLAVFLKDEFLSKDSLGKSKFIKEKLNAKALITDFMEGKIEVLSMEKFFAFIEKTALPKVFAHIKDNRHELSKILNLQDKDFAGFLEKAFEMLKNSPHKEEIIDEIIGALLGLLNRYEGKIRDELTNENAGFFKKWATKAVAGITSYDDKVIDGIREYLENFTRRNDRNRKEIVMRIESYIDDIFQNPQKRKNLNDKIRGALDSKVISKIIEAFTEGLESNKDLPKYICNFIENTLNNFIADERKMEAINRWLRAKIINILVDSSEHISNYVEDTIKGWEAKEISDKLELEIGKDLQFIRLNGTFIGGILGLIIYFVGLGIASVF